jgi:rod shape-determining protein MreB and related proteins
MFGRCPGGLVGCGNETSCSWLLGICSDFRFAPAGWRGLGAGLGLRCLRVSHPPMRLFSLRTGLGGSDLAVDLGTASTVVYVLRSGIVVSEPSIVAVDACTGELRAAGIEACQILGRGTGGICAVRPLKGGVIADLSATVEMLCHFVGKVQRNRWAHPRVVACVPSGVSGVERRAVAEACLSAGAREAYLIETPLAAAVGAGLPVEQPAGSMVLDIGAGISEVAVISMGGIVVSRSIRVGGEQLDEAILNYLKREYKLLSGQHAAEEVKREIGCTFPHNADAVRQILGRDMVSELRRTALLSSGEIRGVLDKPLSRIIELVRQTLDHTPPELAWDIIERGITLVGGGSLLHGLNERLLQETGLTARLADSPCTCAAIGAGKSLQTLERITRPRSSLRRTVVHNTPAALK